MSRPEESSGPDPLRVGETVRTPSRTITPKDIAEFARLTSDENPLHLDEGFARSQVFGGTIVGVIVGPVLA